MIASASAYAQAVVHNNDEHLPRDRPEAWAMNYFAASTFMTGFGATPALAPWKWRIAGDLGYIPRLSDEQQRIGRHGIKREDLNKTPVFGRLRVALGLPGEWVAELGYTPPLSINGATPRELLAAALGHRVLERGAFALSARAFGAHGRVVGDITCPRALAGVADPVRNPDDCRAASDDQLALDYYGAELIASWTAERWQLHTSLGAVRSELAVQVNALTFDVRDRSRLVARGALPFATIGINRRFDAQWSAGVELLYVPLSVRRVAGGPRDNDALASARLELRYRLD